MKGDEEWTLARLEALAKLMDSAFVLPGTKFRFGLDAIVGLVPGIGDAISGAISSYLIWEARRLGASRLLIARMAGNVFDASFRGNMRNVALLRQHLERKTNLRVVDAEVEVGPRQAA